MRILMVNTTCTYGSTGAIMTLLKEQLEFDGHEVYSCYGNNYGVKVGARCYNISSGFENWVSSKIGKYTGYYGWGNVLSTWRLKCIISRIKPEIINLFNLHGPYIDDIELLSYLAKRNIPTVYTMFDEYAYMGRCCFSYECTKFTTFCHDCTHLKDYPCSPYFDRSSYYFKKKAEIYKIFQNIVFVGDAFVYNRSKKSAILKDKHIELIKEPIDYDRIYYPRKTDDLRKKLNIPDGNIVILTVTNYADVRKGGRYFFDMHNLMRDKFGYSFVFVGYDEIVYGKREGVITIPYVNNMDELATFYSLADVFVFTSLADTSPNTVQQALGCGSPVCAFDIEGIQKMNISDDDVLRLSKIGDVEALQRNVLSFHSKDKDTMSKCRDAVFSKYNISCIYKHYLALYNTMINNE